MSMRLVSKNRELVKHIRNLFLTGNFHEMCNEIWYYGEFDFFYDFCRHLQYRYKDEQHRHDMYMWILDIYFNKHYNANLMNPIDGEPRRDNYLDFILGTEKTTKSIKELLG